jgi:acyl carrier protein
VHHPNPADGQEERVEHPLNGGGGAPPREAEQLSEHDLAGWLRERVARGRKVAPDDIDLDEPLTTYGLDSVDAVAIVADLEAWLGLELDATLAWDFPTIQLLARHLAEELRHARTDAGTHAWQALDVNALSDAEVDALLERLQAEHQGPGRG